MKIGPQIAKVIGAGVIRLGYELLLNTVLKSKFESPMAKKHAIGVITFPSCSANFFLYKSIFKSSHGATVLLS